MVKLRCPNCGEEEERVMYCDQCDEPMDIVEIVDKDEDDVQTGVATNSVKVQNSNDSDEDKNKDEDLVGEDPEVEKMIKDGTLGNIFETGEAGGAEEERMGENPASPDMSMDEIVDLLDKEE
jgi:hypothetical protein